MFCMPSTPLRLPKAVSVAAVFFFFFWNRASPPPLWRNNFSGLKPCSWGNQVRCYTFSVDHSEHTLRRPRAVALLALGRGKGGWASRMASSRHATHARTSKDFERASERLPYLDGSPSSVRKKKKRKVGAGLVGFGIAKCAPLTT